MTKAGRATYLLINVILLYIRLIFLSTPPFIFYLTANPNFECLLEGKVVFYLTYIPNAFFRYKRSNATVSSCSFWLGHREVLVVKIKPVLQVRSCFTSSLPYSN